jgi:hypothetical protein
MAIANFFNSFRVIRSQQGLIRKGGLRLVCHLIVRPIISLQQGRGPTTGPRLDTADSQLEPHCFYPRNLMQSYMPVNRIKHDSPTATTVRPPRLLRTGGTSQKTRHRANHPGMYPDMCIARPRHLGYHASKHAFREDISANIQLCRPISTRPSPLIRVKRQGASRSFRK